MWYAYSQRPINSDNFLWRWYYCLFLEKKPENAVERINRYLEKLDVYLKERQLFASPAKCSALLISSWNKERRKELNAKLDESPIPTVNELKLLAALFDHGFNFNKHVEKINNVAIQRNLVIRPQTSSKTGLQKDGWTSFYKALTRSSLFLCLPCLVSSAVGDLLEQAWTTVKWSIPVNNRMLQNG